MEYRLAIASDIDAIAGLHADSWQRHYRGAYSDSYLDGDVATERKEVWTDRFAHSSPDAYTIVAELDGTIAGFAHTILDCDPT